MQRHSTRFKPSLLQRFGEEILPETHWNQGKEVPTQRNLTDSLTMTPKSMNLSPKSVETQRDQGNILQEMPLMTKSTSMELLTRNEESSNPKCPGIPEKKMRDEMGTKTEESQRILHLFAWSGSYHLYKILLANASTDICLQPG